VDFLDLLLFVLTQICTDSVSRKMSVIQWKQIKLPSSSDQSIALTQRRSSVDTLGTDKSEKFEMEESEFLEPVDKIPVMVDDEDDYQG
jgi:hypothetical protein